MQMIIKNWYTSYEWNRGTPSWSCFFIYVWIIIILLQTSRRELFLKFKKKKIKITWEVSFTRGNRCCYLIFCDRYILSLLYWSPWKRKYATMIFGSLKLSFYACVCQTSPMCEVQCRRLLHQEGRALQSLKIRFFVLFWRRIIDFKKDETKKNLLCFRF